MLRIVFPALSALALVASLLGGSVYAANMPEMEPRGDAAAGESRVTTCAACHGREGVAIMASYPNLGGQNFEYLYDQLVAFKSGERYAPLMAGQLQGFDEQDLRDIAAYYAAQPVPDGVAEGAQLDLGERIYRGGLAEKNVPACKACHAPTGMGNAPAGFPVLSGQQAEYTASQLEAYRAGERQTDEWMGGVMRDIASGLSDPEIAAVSAFVRGLHPGRAMEPVE